MQVCVRVFREPKAGSSREEYEDASWVGPGEVTEATPLDLERLRVCIADGVTESLLAGRWANLLVASVGEADRRHGHERILRHAIEAWKGVLSEYIEAREKRGKPIQWYEEPGLDRGAMATMLAADFEGADGRGSWKAWAIGDACAFQVRDAKLEAAFPIARSDEFDSTPAMVSSKTTDLRALLRSSRRKHGRWQRGDVFYFATDALAAWFLRALEEGERPWEVLRDLGPDEGPSDFAQWVASMRDSGTLKNDDTTLVRVELL
jgi:hypothetical protein